MDKDRLRKICESALDTSFSGITLTEFRALPTQKYDEVTNKWIPDSYSLFIVLEKPPVCYKDFNYSSFDDDSNSRNVENFLESLLGFDVCVDFLQNR